MDLRELTKKHAEKPFDSLQSGAVIAVTRDDLSESLLAFVRELSLASAVATQGTGDGK